ncbi:hypothetical protein [Streptomyces cacaoi]|uniref:hypothetical protein n=1 Tax=Streptomyces cacaoi TaxID=1898 RepID=UPI003748A708
MNNAPTITPAIASQVLSHYGQGGYPAGSWGQKLISLIATADELNFIPLADAFPAYAAAVTAMQYDPDGAAYLQRIAGEGQ